MQHTRCSARGLLCSLQLLFLFGLADSGRLIGAEPAPELLRRFEGNKDFVYCAVFSPDGNYILSGGGGSYSDNQWLPGDQDYTLWLWDVATGKSIRRLEGHTNHVAGVAFSGDGKQAISGSLDGTLRLWEIRTGNPIGIYEGHRGRINGVGLTKDGKGAA